MKKLVVLVCFFTIILSSFVFASDPKANIENISENLIRVTVSADNNISVTGYTISKGKNIIVYYLSDDKGFMKDTIDINLSSVLKPYTLILADSSKPPSDQPFEDIKSHELKDYIRHLYDLGFIKGYDEDNSFKPDNSITRAELFTLIVRMMNFNEKFNERIKFDDLDNKHWAYNDVLKAVDNGLIEGYYEEGKRLLKLNNNITVGEASKIISQAFKVNNKDNINYDLRFSKHWARSYIQDLLNESIILSTDDFYTRGELDRPIKRGEVAMLISRALGR